MSVLNVFKTSVDTINASSITSDMTIGANLNGGSLTLGGINSVTNITSGTINASNFKLYSTQLGANQSFWMDTIGGTLNQELVLGYNNASHIYVGGPKTTYLVIGGDKGIVNIANNGLVAGARVNIATGTNATNTEMTLGSTTLSKCFIRGGDVNINHTTGGSIYMGSDTTGTTNILGHVNIGALSTATGSIIIGNQSAPGYTLIASKGITLARYLGNNEYVDIAAQANTTTGYTILGSGNLQNNYIRGRNVNINSDVTGNTYVGNTTGESKMFGSNVFIHGSVLYVNSNSNGFGHSRIQMTNYGTYLYAETIFSDVHRYKMHLRNTNVFQVTYDYNNAYTGSYFSSRFGFTTDTGIGDFAEMFEWEDKNPENEKRLVIVS